MIDAAWLHTIDPFVFRITPTFGVRWYGVAYLAGFLCGWLLLRALAKRRITLLTPEQVGDAMLSLVLGVFIGGRVGYMLFYQPALLITFTTDPPFWGAIAINHGGMSSHGGLIGVIIACLWIARHTKVPALHIMDLVSLVAPIGLFFGRLANFINGELLGKIVARPGQPGPWWSVRFPQELLTGHAPALSDLQRTQLFSLLDRVSPEWWTKPGVKEEDVIHLLIQRVQQGSTELAQALTPLLAARHPSQLYQAFAEGPILMATLWFVWARPRKPGVVGAWFLMVYGVLRIITELWRLPDDDIVAPHILGLSRGQWLSAVMVAAGAIALAIITRRKDTAAIGGWRRRRRSAEKAT